MSVTFTGLSVEKEDTKLLGDGKREEAQLPRPDSTKYRNNVAGMSGGFSDTERTFNK